MFASDAAAEQVADTLAERIPQVRERYEAALSRMDSVLLSEPVAREQALQHAENLILDICAAIRERSWPSEPSTAELANLELATDIGAKRASAGIHPVESLRAASVLYDVALSTVEQCVTELGCEPADIASLTAIAARSLHVSLMTRIRIAANAYCSFLLGQIHSAHVDERARIARELHDRLGSGISAASRCVELGHAYLSRSPDIAEQRITQAEGALRETLENLREIANDLHLHPHAGGIEKALLRYVESMRTDDIRANVQVSGDEGWVTPAVLDELVLVLREAIRNAFVHGQPNTVLTQVDIAPHEVRASVNDDGQGFDVSACAEGDGLGLVSMRERISLLGGVVSIFSVPGRGTSVEARVPLGADHAR